MARRGYRVVRVGSSRLNEWFSAGLAPTTLSAGTTLLATLNAAALALRPFTIVRTRMAICYTSDQAVASESSQGIFSMQVVTQAAASAGVASVPTPLNETNADYFVYQAIGFDFSLATAVGFTREQGGNVFTAVDSKAMRKVGNDDDVAWVVQQRSAIGAIIGLEGRFLVKLH